MKGAFREEIYVPKSGFSVGDVALYQDFNRKARTNILTQFTMEDKHISGNHCGAVLFTARVVLPCAKLGIAYGRDIGQDNGTHSATRNLTETVYTEHCRYKRNQAQIACSIQADPASSL